MARAGREDESTHEAGASPRVFLSYSHESEAHAQRVRALADQLRSEGVDARLDQYEPNPPEGWPRWTEQQLRGADAVLLVCTAVYRRRYDREAPAGEGEGHGVAWEALIAEQALYDAGGLNQRLIPVLFEEGRVEDVPRSLRAFTRHRLPEGYEALYRRLTGQVERMPPLGAIRRVPGRLAASGGALPSSRSLLTPEELAEYQRLTRARHETLALDGFGSKLRQSPLLREVYVSRQATDHQLDPKEAIASGEQLLHGPGERRSLDDVLALAQRCRRRAVVMLGDPGSGKTTQLKWMLLQALDGRMKGLPPTALPVFLPLRKLRPAESMAAFVQRVIVGEAGHLPEDFGARLVKSTDVLFLLDALDEVADAERATVVRWIEERFGDDGDDARPDHRVVVTCRHASYVEATKLGAAFLELQLAPLGPAEVETLVTRWYELHPEERPHAGEGGAKRWATALLDELAKNRSQHVAAIKGNPLLLTAICMVRAKRPDGVLPVDAESLFEQCTDVLLESWPKRAKGKQVPLDAKQAREVLRPTAYCMQREGLEDATTAELHEAVCEGIERANATEASPRVVLEAMRDTSGLLVGWKPDQYRFVHRGFREYLAALELRTRPDERELERVARGFGDSWWREVIPVMLAHDDGLLARFMQHVVRQERFVEWASSELMDEVLARAGAGVGARVQPWVPLVQVIKRRAGEPGASSELEALVRRGPAAWVGAFARLEEGRPVGLETKVVKGVELVRVPGGAFVMGSPEGEEGRFEQEGPQHEVVLESFWLARTPVTNAQYRRYLQDPQRGSSVRDPRLWGDRRYHQDEQPVVGLSWEEAQAYCEWAGLKLPTEAQWEYACRAGTTTRYWSGDGKDDLKRVAWYGGNSGGRLHAVGEKPTNDFGLYDMHGNVREWCQDKWVGSYKDAVHQPEDGLRVQPVGVAVRVIRGGYFGENARYVRSAYRFRDRPDYRWEHVGFRPALLTSRIGGQW